MSKKTCSVCQCKFDIDKEGGISGDFGILPVDFCPTCLSCMVDMVNQFNDGVEDIDD